MFQDGESTKFNQAPILVLAGILRHESESVICNPELEHASQIGKLDGDLIEILLRDAISVCAGTQRRIGFQGYF